MKNLIRAGGNKILMKLFIVTLFFLLHEGIKAQGPRTPADSVIEERLVELAINGPEYQKVEHQSKVYEYQLKTARNSWMNFLTISANYNDQTFAKNGNQTYVYPKYFFGITIPLGTILSGNQAKIARESVSIGTLTQEETRRKIRADVIGKYRQYKAQTAIIAIETGYMNDLQAELSAAEEKFKLNSIPFETYNSALKNKNTQQTRLITLKLELDLIRLEIERMIGTNLDSVIK
ncbi:MAG: TolC family protein [Flavisolibacter sp.]